MQNLPTFLRDTKHTLQVIEDLNQQIEDGEVSLDGVAVVSLDVVSMYTNMTEEIGTSASKDYLQSRGSQVGVGNCPEELKVKTESILSALELCIRNNLFKFSSKIYKQTEGVGTGIKLAPPFACLGMGKYEELVFQSDKELTKLILV